MAERKETVPWNVLAKSQIAGSLVLSIKARNRHEELIKKIAVPKDGYIETYLVNETSDDVWFDQFSIMSTGPLIVQETHYDPWGVELSGLGYQYGEDRALKKCPLDIFSEGPVCRAGINPYLYNGKERAERKRMIP
ncbi:hypothetical protein [Algoriphagus sp. Y33]|uniref:hypothetical protein n=1 Tax=Algoriphagus sp. Y33 TaxID=2772483 RepID=UPI00178153AC|nr:hypothetical protein [Algoriphagus sp. Y33]